MPERGELSSQAAPIELRDGDLETWRLKLRDQEMKSPLLKWALLSNLSLAAPFPGWSWRAVACCCEAAHFAVRSLPSCVPPGFWRGGSYSVPRDRSSGLHTRR